MGFPKGDIQVARFLGDSSTLSRGLPPRSRRASAKQPVECSVNEAARFAAPKVLRRAWFSLPLADVFSGVQVGVTATVALGTREVVAVPRPLVTAG